MEAAAAGQHRVGGQADHLAVGAQVGHCSDAVGIVRLSTLDEVGDAVAEYASSGGTAAYVERAGDRYRWSPATSGGGYALLCLVARFLRCRPSELTVGFHTVDDVWWVVNDPDDEQPVDEYVAVDLSIGVDQITHRLHDLASIDRRE